MEQQEEIPAHIREMYEAALKGDNERIGTLFQKASESQQSEMYQEMVAMKMTVPLCAGIVHWLAEGWKLDGEKLDTEEIPMAIRHVIGVIIMQLESALEEESPFIQQLADRVVRDAESGGEE